MKRLADKIKRHIKIWRLQARNSLMMRMAYRYNFVFMAVGVFLQMALSLIFIDVIFGFVPDIAGWEFKQALVVVGSYMLIEGFMWATCAYLSGISHSVKMGTLDYILVQPKDSQFLVSVWRADPEDWTRVITAVIVLSYAISGLNLTALEFIFGIFYYLILMLNAYIMMYSITLIIKSLSFWTTEVRGLWSMVDSITKTSQYPVDIFFHKAVRIIFSTIMPIAFIATVPAKILINGFDFWLIAASCFLAIIFFIVSRKFWLYGLKHYSSASS